MTLPFRPLPSLLLLALLGAGTAVAGPQSAPETAAPHPRGHERPPQQRQQPERPARSEDGLSDSVRKIERSTRGQVLSAERVPYDGRNLNRIKVVDERGRVRIYMDDPAQSSGRQSNGTQSSDGQQPAATPTRRDDD